MQKLLFVLLSILWLPIGILGVYPLSAEDVPKASPKPYSKKELVKYCSPRTVDLEVRGRDDQGPVDFSRRGDHLA